MRILTPSITRRERGRRLKSGATIVQTRFVVNFREPHTGRRRQFFFERHKDALAKRDEILASVVTGTYSDLQTDLTVAKAVEYWLENRRTHVKKGTWDSYRHAVGYIIRPLLIGTKSERQHFTRRGKKPKDSQFVQMLGSRRIGDDLTTADIRTWHKTLTSQVSSYTANVAKNFLRAALALAAEDFNLRVPPMPSNLGRGRSKLKKTILKPEQVGRLLQAALEDERKGIYYAFPFLTGVRPSEQLALLWQDVDLADGVVHIRRMQERDGSISEITKTTASAREIPMSRLLKCMLLQWQVKCPTKNGTLERVFPFLGPLQSEHHKKRGGPLSYANFRASYWRPALLALGLPYVTPHSARHAFISILQARSSLRHRPPAGM